MRFNLKATHIAAIDPEAGGTQKRLISEPTLPIYLKVISSLRYHLLLSQIFLSKKSTQIETWFLTNYSLTNNWKFFQGLELMIDIISIIVIMILK